MAEERLANLTSSLTKYSSDSLDTYLGRYTPYYHYVILLTRVARLHALFIPIICHVCALKDFGPFS